MSRGAPGSERAWRPLVAGATLFMLSGCSSMHLAGPQDGPGARIDADSIPRVVPHPVKHSRYGNPSSYVVNGHRYHVRKSAAGYVATGIASWYGSKFHGRKTSSGEPYNMYRMTAAHRTLPLPTYVRVTNLDNGRSAVVKVNDRGPFRDNRLIDLSYAAAVRLGVVKTGTAHVRVRALTPGADNGGSGSGESTPAPPQSDVGAASAAASGSGAVYVQVGAFRHFENAQEMRARVAGADILGVDVDRGRTADGKRIYRVRVGPLDADARRKVLGKLDLAGIGPVRIVDDDEQ